MSYKPVHGSKHLGNNRVLYTVESNKKQKVSFLSIGEERLPLFVVDDFVADPENLVLEAEQGLAFSQDSTDFYPGVRKAINKGYSDFICEFALRHIVPAVFEIHTDISVSLCAFSIANQSPKSLLPIQRIPHFDTSSHQQWAVVQYLCDPSHGGTGFFRHKSTGFETISDCRVKQYQRVLEDEAITKGLPPEEYLSGSSELFEMIHRVEARFNRALFYPSNLLHSGLINKWQANNLGPARLTANTFIQFG